MAIACVAIDLAKAFSETITVIPTMIPVTIVVIVRITITILLLGTLTTIRTLVHHCYSYCDDVEYSDCYCYDYSC